MQNSITNEKLNELGFGEKGFAGKYNMKINNGRIGYRYFKGLHRVDFTTKYMKSGVEDSVGGVAYNGTDLNEAIRVIEEKIKFYK